MAAKKAGQSPGQWLTRVILDAASDELKHSKELGPTQEQMLAQLVESVGQLKTEMADMKAQQQTKATPRGRFLGVFPRRS